MEDYFERLYNATDQWYKRLMEVHKMKAKTNNLTVTPVKKYAAPKYPTRAVAEREPGMLKKLPQRWEKNAAVVAAVGMLGAMALTSCGTERQPHENPPMTAATSEQESICGTIGSGEDETEEEFYLMGDPAPIDFASEQEFTGIETDWGALMGTQAIEIDTEQAYNENATQGTTPEPANFINVAPLFVHGAGTGSIGCEMIVPPVFMSEQEALAIIRSISEAAGLNLSASLTPPAYRATDNRTDSEYAGEQDYALVLGGGKVGLDLYDKNKNVAVAYISMREAGAKYVDSAGETIEDPHGSAYYNPRELARLTIEDFAKQRGDISIGVLYDPGVSWGSEGHQNVLNRFEENHRMLFDTYERLQNGNWPDEFHEKYDEIRSEYEIDARALIEQDLRNQVRDFLEWLQGQGII